MGCASSKATHVAVAGAASPSKSKAAVTSNQQAGVHLHPPATVNPNAAVVVATPEKNVTLTTSVDQGASTREEEVNDSKQVISDTIDQRTDVVPPSASHDQETHQVHVQFEHGDGSYTTGQPIDQHEKDVEPTEGDKALTSEAADTDGAIGVEESIVNTDEEASPAVIAEIYQDQVTEITDDSEMVVPTSVELTGLSDMEVVNENSSSSSKVESCERCTEEKDLTPLDVTDNYVPDDQCHSDAGTIDGAIEEVPTVGERGRSDAQPAETSTKVDVADAVSENVRADESAVAEHDQPISDQTEPGQVASNADTCSSDVPEPDLPSAPEKTDKCAEPTSESSNESQDVSEVEHGSDDGGLEADTQVISSAGDRCHHPATDSVNEPECGSAPNLKTPDESQPSPNENLPSTEADHVVPSEISSPSDTMTTEECDALDAETVKETKLDTERDASEVPQRETTAAAPSPPPPSSPPVSVTESIDKILGGSEDSEPITELRNVTSMTRVLIPDDKRNSKPSVVDRWGLSTTMNKIKTKALSKLDGTADETVVTVAALPSAPSESSESSKVNAKPTSTSKTTGWSSPKSVERVLLSLSEELTPPSPPSSSPLRPKSPAAASKTKVSRSGSGQELDLTTGSSKKKKNSGATAPAAVSRELTDIEKARLFAASVLAETERRGAGDAANGATNTSTASSSWWKQKVMSSLQHEL